MVEINWIELNWIEPARFCLNSCCKLTLIDTIWCYDCEWNGIIGHSFPIEFSYSEFRSWVFIDPELRLIAVNTVHNLQEGEQ